MDRFELIEAVRELNSTASIEFLSQFSQGELEAYLERLLQALLLQTYHIILRLLVESSH